MELTESLERMVLDGRLGPGDRLPPVRTMSDLVGLAPNTVAVAYRRLGDRGTIEGRGRAGTFVREGPHVPRVEPAVPSGLVDLASGNPDPDLLPDLSSIEVGGPTVLYGDPPVDPALEPPARRCLEAAGVPTGSLAVMAGALDGVERALQAHLRVGDAVAIEAPGWPPFADLIRVMGLRPVTVEVDDRGMLPGRLAAVLDDVSAVVCTPRMQNPTGAAVDAGRAAALAAVLARRPEVLVVEDDHGGLICEEPLIPLGPSRRRWAVVQSVSKSLGPDLRTAFLTGDDVTVERIVSRQSAGPGWVSHILQRLTARVLDDPRTDGLLARASAAYALRRTALLSELAARGVRATGRTGLNVWVWVPDEETVVAALAAEGFAARAGRRWRAGTPPAVRISIGRLDPAAAPDIALVVARHSRAHGGSRSA
jgi:DNA-binding transcriptional MocR family regulator